MVGLLVLHHFLVGIISKMIVMNGNDWSMRDLKGECWCVMWVGKCLVARNDLLIANVFFCLGGVRWGKHAVPWRRRRHSAAYPTANLSTCVTPVPLRPVTYGSSTVWHPLLMDPIQLLWSLYATLGWAFGIMKLFDCTTALAQRLPFLHPLAFKNPSSKESSFEMLQLH